MVFYVLLLFLDYLHCFSVVVVFAAADVFVLFFSHNDFSSLFFQFDCQFIIGAFFLLEFIMWVWCFTWEFTLQLVFVVIWSYCCCLECESWLIVVFGVCNSVVASDLSYGSVLLLVMVLLLALQFCGVFVGIDSSINFLCF